MAREQTEGQVAHATQVFHPSLHADPTFLAALAREQAAAHFDEAEREVAAALTVLESVWADSAWESRAAQAFRFAVFDHIASVAALQRTIAACRWEVGA